MSWEGKTPKPTRKAGGAPCIEVAIQRVLTCNVSLVKEHDRLKRMQVRAHSTKIQLAEIQLQFDPTNEHVRAILT
jgi:hypothetical protein